MIGLLSSPQPVHLVWLASPVQLLCSHVPECSHPKGHLSSWLELTECWLCLDLTGGHAWRFSVGGCLIGLTSVTSEALSWGRNVAEKAPELGS